MNTKVVSILGLLAIAGIAAAYFAARSPSSESGEASTSSATASGSVVLPDLASRSGDVAQITVKRAPMEFTIKKDGDTWRVAEKANYPAKIETVRAAVVGLSQLRTVEAKTTRADQYSKLGVDDPIAPPPESASKDVPQSALVTLKDATGQPIASLIVGNPKYSGQGASGASTPELYIRKAGDKQSWLVSGQVDLPREPIGWLDTTFANIKRDRVKSLSITHPDGSTVSVSHDKQAEPFAVQGVPVGRELKDPGVGESIAGSLTSLGFQDVAAAASVDPASSPPPTGGEITPGPTIVLRTFDGLIVTVKSVHKEAKAWWTLAATADESLAAPPPPPTPPPAPVAPTDPTKPADAAKPAEPPAAAPSVGTVEALRKEVADLNAQWSPYAFAPVDWKVRSINTTMADLLKEPPAPPATPAPSATPPGAPTPTPATPAPAPQGK